MSDSAAGGFNKLNAYSADGRQTPQAVALSFPAAKGAHGPCGAPPRLTRLEPSTEFVRPGPHHRYPASGIAPGRGGALLSPALRAMFMASDFWLGILLCFTFIACAILAGMGTGPRALAFLAVAAGSFALLGFTDIPFGLAWVLVPTVIHVSVFTLVFMTVGAFRSRSAAQFALVGFYLAAIAAILLVPPSRATVIPSLARLGGEYFGDIPLALGSLLRIPNLTFDTRFTGLLSFVYTYHYLNWFIKADVIRWADVPRPRLVAIAGLSLVATGLYFYNYAYGFAVLLLLSFLHVLLEFPLNSISIRQLGAAIGGTLRPRRPAAASG